MSMTHAVTSAYRDNRLLQHVEEVQTAYRTFPTNPTMVDDSVVNHTSTTYNTLYEAYQKLGQRQIFKFIKTGRERTWTMEWSPVDTSQIRYGTENGNAAGTLTGTGDKSLSYWNSVRRAVGNFTLTEYHITRVGTKMDSVTVSTTSRGLVTCSAEMISSDIPKPTLTSPIGAGVPATPTTTTPWSHLTGGVSKLTLGGVVYVIKRASATVGNNFDQGDIDGSEFIEYLEFGTKDVTFEADVVIGKDLALEDDIETLGDIGSASLMLNSTGPKSMVFVAPIVCIGKEEDRAIGQGAEVRTFQFRATDVSTTA